MEFKKDDIEEKSEESEETPCPNSGDGDGQHCNCWFDGMLCCYCGYN